MQFSPPPSSRRAPTATAPDPRLPLYIRIRDILRNEIGSLAPGARLPTEPELMARFAASRITVRAAVADLVAEGLVTRRAGSGTFVAEPRLEQSLTRLTGFVEDMKALNLTPEARLVTTKRVTADMRVAERLHVPPGKPVILIERVRLANGQPISFDVTYLPLHIGERVLAHDLELYPIFELLEDKHGIKLGEAEYRIEASNASPRVAKLLGDRPNAALLMIERTTFAATGEPIDFEILHYRGDRVRYRLLLKR